MQKICVRFSTYFAFVRAMKCSDVSEDDEILFGTAFFSNWLVQRQHEDVGRASKYIHA